jgi:hypothetical protein
VIFFVEDMVIRILFEKTLTLDLIWFFDLLKTMGVVSLFILLLESHTWRANFNFFYLRI